MYYLDRQCPYRALPGSDTVVAGRMNQGKVNYSRTALLNLDYENIHHSTDFFTASVLACDACGTTEQQTGYLQTAGSQYCATKPPWSRSGRKIFEWYLPCEDSE